MFEVTVVGENVADLVQQMKVFITAFSVAAPAAAALIKTVVASAAPDPDPSKTAPSTAVVEPPQEIKVDLKKLREEALAMARDVFKTGKDGAAKTRAIAKSFGVAKLGDVSDDQVADMHAKLTAAKAEIGAASAGA